MKDVIFPKVTVSSWSVSGNQLTLPVTGENLSDINSLVQLLEKESIVDYCNVMTAMTDGSSEEQVQPDKVTGQIVIYLLDPVTAAGMEETGTEEAVTEEAGMKEAGMEEDGTEEVGMEDAVTEETETEGGAQ